MLGEDIKEIGRILRVLGLLHRDIRTKNLCISKKGCREGRRIKLVLIDWKYVEYHATFPKTGDGSKVKKPLLQNDLYQPPEIVWGGEYHPEYSHDEWSLYVVLEQIYSWNKYSLFHGKW